MSALRNHFICKGLRGKAKIFLKFACVCVYRFPYVNLHFDIPRCLPNLQRGPSPKKKKKRCTDEDCSPPISFRDLGACVAARRGPRAARPGARSRRVPRGTRTPPAAIGRRRSHSELTRQGSRSLAPPASFSPRLARKAGNVELEQRTPRSTASGDSVPPHT